MYLKSTTSNNAITHTLDAKLAFNKHVTNSNEIQQFIELFANKSDEIAKHVPVGYKHTINKDSIGIKSN